jgi:hypothetical protein
VEKLRFDAQVSPVDVIPADLSDRVYRIVRNYAGGAVTWDGSAWVDQEPAQVMSDAQKP